MRIASNLYLMEEKARSFQIEAEGILLKILFVAPSKEVTTLHHLRYLHWDQWAKGPWWGVAATTQYEVYLYPLESSTYVEFWLLQKGLSNGYMWWNCVICTFLALCAV